MQDIYYEPLRFPEINTGELAKIVVLDRYGYESGFSFHWHYAIELTLTLLQPVRLRVNGQISQILPGDFIYVNSREVHSTEAVYPEKRIQGLLLLISDQMFRSVCPDFDQYRIEIPAGHPGRQEIIASLQRIYDYKRHPSPYDQALINAELWQIVYRMLAFLQPKKTEDARPDQRETLAKQALSYIDLHFKEPLTLREAAAAVGLQENYFCRYFKKCTGMSFGQYLSQIRLHYALAYMLDFDGSVVESGLQAGFPSAKSFTAYCRRTYGLTPAQYKRRQTEKSGE